MKKEQVLQALKAFQDDLDERGYKRSERQALIFQLSKRLGLTRSQIKYLTGVDGEKLAQRDNVQI